MTKQAFIELFDELLTKRLAPQKNKDGEFARLLRMELMPKRQKLVSEVRKIQITHAAVDEKGLLVSDEQGNFRYSKDSIFALEEAMDKFHAEEIVIQIDVTVFTPEIQQIFADYGFTTNS